MRAAASPGACCPRTNHVLWALRTWLDSWPGIGHVAVGMHRQGFDLQLTQYDDRGWRATFYTAGMEHSPRSAIVTSRHLSGSALRIQAGRLAALGLRG